GHRPRQERQHLDEGDQGQDVDWNPARNEQLEEMQTVLPEAVDDHGEKDEQRERHRDDDVAGDREGIRDDPHYVQDEDKHEEREYEREELHALAAGSAAQRA